MNKQPAVLDARLTDQLQQYWMNLKGSRQFPREDEVDTDALTDIWNSCFLVDVRNRQSFAYSYLGTSLIEAYGEDFTGHEITETLLYPHPESLFRAFHDVLRTVYPKTDGGEFQNIRGELVKYRSCVLPLGSLNTKGVTYLLGGMRWKLF